MDSNSQKSFYRLIRISKINIPNEFYFPNFFCIIPKHILVHIQKFELLARQRPPDGDTSCRNHIRLIPRTTGWPTDVIVVGSPACRRRKTQRPLIKRDNVPPPPVTRTRTKSVYVHVRPSQPFANKTLNRCDREERILFFLVSPAESHCPSKFSRCGLTVKLSINRPPVIDPRSSAARVRRPSVPRDALITFPGQRATGVHPQRPRHAHVRLFHVHNPGRLPDGDRHEGAQSRSVSIVSVPRPTSDRFSC